MIVTVIFEGIPKAASVLPVLMKVYTIPHHDRGYLYVVLFLQSCSDSLHILPSTSSDTYVTSSDYACHIVNVKVEKDLDMEEEEEEVIVKTEKGIGSEEEECIVIKDVDVRYSKEEEEEDGIDIKEEEGHFVIIKEEECVDIEEEVSLEGTV